MMSPQKVLYQVIPVIPNIYILYAFISRIWKNTILLYPEHQNLVLF